MKVPDLNTKEEAREFWDSHSVVDYVEDLEEIEIEPKSDEIKIILTIDEILKSEIESIASEDGIEYKSLIRNWINEKVREYYHKKAS